MSQLVQNKTYELWYFTSASRMPQEGQAEVASWLWSPYSKTVLPLSCDTGVEQKALAASNPKGCTQAVTYFYTVIGLGFSVSLARQ